MSKKKLAIVSTYDDLCGIAGYTRALESQLAGDFDVEVLDLDQFFMKGQIPKIRRLGHQFVADLASRLRDFDAVNIQLEHGILGSRPKDIVKRYLMLSRAARDLCVTFHTIIPPSEILVSQALALVAKGKFGELNVQLATSRGNGYLNQQIQGSLRRRQAFKWTSAIFHTRRDARLMKYVYGLKNVFDHPLVFYPESRRAEGSSASALPATLAGRSDVRLIGVFGFLNEYKGFETAIKALRHLPENCHLIIFGGLHPNEIKKNVPIHPYIERLLNTGEVDRTAVEALRLDGASLNLSVSSGDIAKLLESPLDLSKRIHFLGAQTDEGFADGMLKCDVVVLPYLEVGQSASGPMSMAVDLGARIVAARNHAFLQFARYNPDRVSFFEIGNHIELAARVEDTLPRSYSDYRSNYTVESNRAIYRNALGSA